MVNIAVLGYGVVGSGVVDVIMRNSTSILTKSGSEITVKKILDIRLDPEKPYTDLVTLDAAEIFNDDSISIIVETIGGVKAAYEFTKRALKLHKSVVTSNKELVATHGPELLKLAKDNDVHYMFEASVGGGIPIIRPMNQCLAANEIQKVVGILNGTTNYILTQMKRNGKDFEEALKEAQQNGYAEANPSADVDGHDACRKIAILSSIAYEMYIDSRKIHTEGIRDISVADMKYAEQTGSVIKLIAMSEKKDGKIFARVSPAMVGKTSPLASVEDVFNAIIIKGDAIGDAMFYGRGAGKYPTASAVVADVINIVTNTVKEGSTWEVDGTDKLVDHSEIELKFFVRAEVGNKKQVEEALGPVTWLASENDASELAFVTKAMKEKKFIESSKNLRVIKYIRCLDI